MDKWSTLKKKLKVWIDNWKRWESDPEVDREVINCFVDAYECVLKNMALLERGEEDANKYES